MRLTLFFFCSLFLLTACGASSEETAIPESRIIYGLSQSISGLDPHQHDSVEMAVITRQIYDTLLYRHPETNDFVPGLAESWSVSEDGLIYTFQLRRNVIFHDGTALTTDAVVTSLNRMLNPEIGSEKVRTLLRPLSAYQIIDDYSFNLILSEPYPALLDALSQVYTAIMSPAAIAEYSNLRYQFHQSGTGAFILEDYLPEQYVILRRNPNYGWMPDFYGIADSDIQEIEFRFIRDEAAQREAIERGTVHIMQGISPLDARALSISDSVQVQASPIPGQGIQLYMNLTEAPMNDVALRQALLYGSNRIALADAVYQGFTSVAWGAIVSRTQFYNGGVEGVYAYDLTQAEALLSLGGYEDVDNDSVRDLPAAFRIEENRHEPLRLQLIYPIDPSLQEIVDNLAGQWRSIGILLDAVPIPGSQAFQEALETGDYHLALHYETGMDPVFLNQYFLVDVYQNIECPQDPPQYQNESLHNFLILASQERDFATRYTLYGRIQACILEQSLVIPLVEPVNLVAYQPTIQNLRFDAYGWYSILHDLRQTP